MCLRGRERFACPLTVITALRSQLDDTDSPFKWHWSLNQYWSSLISRRKTQRFRLQLSDWWHRHKRWREMAFCITVSSFKLDCHICALLFFFSPSFSFLFELSSSSVIDFFLHVFLSLVSLTGKKNFLLLLTELFSKLCRNHCCSCRRKGSPAKEARVSWIIAVEKLYASWLWWMSCEIMWLKTATSFCFLREVGESS